MVVNVRAAFLCSPTLGIRRGSRWPADLRHVPRGGLPASSAPDAALQAAFWWEFQGLLLNKSAG